MSIKIVALTERQRVILRELLARVAPCSTDCDASYAEFDELGALMTDQQHPTHRHVERNLGVRFIADIAEVGCDRPMTLFEGECGKHYVRASAEFTDRFTPIS